PAGRGNGGLTLDANHDDRFDLFLLGQGQPRMLLLNEPKPRPQGPKQPLLNPPPPGPPPPVDNGQQAGTSNKGGADSSSLFLFGPGQPPIVPVNKPKPRLEPPPPGPPPVEASEE